MIRSMTGFGEAQLMRDNVSYALEVRTLNNRYLKTTIKLPENLQFLEADVERWLRARVLRGSVTYVLRVRNSSAAAAYDINRAALERYLVQLRGAPLPEGVSASVDLATVLAMPGVCQAPEQDEAFRERIRAVVQELTVAAMERLVRMRGDEGRALKKDLISHCDRLRQLTEAIAARAPGLIEEYQQKLRSRVAMLISDAKLQVEQETLLREVAIYADRCDISEELARLTSHVDQFVKLCDDPELVGRKLDFLTQEMLREANTIGSKSNDAATARNVVEMKGSIDRLKEQIQNVE